MVKLFSCTVTINILHKCVRNVGYHLRKKSYIILLYIISIIFYHIKVHSFYVQDPDKLITCAVNFNYIVVIARLSELFLGTLILNFQHKCV